MKKKFSLFIIIICSITMVTGFTSYKNSGSSTARVTPKENTEQAAKGMEAIPLHNIKVTFSCTLITSAANVKSTNASVKSINTSAIRTNASTKSTNTASTVKDIGPIPIRNIRVTDSRSLKASITAAKAGDHIILTNGNYNFSQSVYREKR